MGDHNTLRITHPITLQNTNDSIIVEGGMICKQSLHVLGNLTFPNIPTTTIPPNDVQYLHVIFWNPVTKQLSKIHLSNITQISSYDAVSSTPARIPLGMIITFAGDLLTGDYALCDGRELNRTSYQTLYDLIGSIYGNGDGLTTFNVPNYSGRFLRGVDDGATVDPDSSNRIVTFSSGVGSTQNFGTGNPINNFVTDIAGTHSHLLQFSGGTIYSGSGANTINGNFDDSTFTDYAGTHSHTIIGGDSETTPVNIYVKYYIKIV